MKSVNMIEDFARPDVLARYKPTRQSLEVVRAIIGVDGSSASNVVAPYGSGKSFAALVGITLLSNDHEHKAMVLDRLNGAGKSLRGSEFMLGPNLSITLTGYCPQLPELLCRNVGIPEHQDIKEVTKGLQARLKDYKCFAIIWDEFGHHLETLVREGRSEDLLNVQILAEWVVRRTNPTVTFTTLTHKNLNTYITGASQTLNNAWKKIEGRFDTVRLDTSAIDSYEMIADALQTQSRKSFKTTTRKVQSVGFFNEIEPATVENILSRTVPLTPAALEILPRLGAKFAQNERTLYQFLKEEIVDPDRKDSVGLDVLYDYFAQALASDTGPGGAYRRFIEAETALSQTSDMIQQQIIKATALLQLGNHSQRLNLSKQKLKIGVAECSGVGVRKVSNAIETLIRNKILLYRRHTDDISVWYGTEFDLTSAIDEETSRLSYAIDPIEALERLMPPEPYLAAEYNYRRSITRYASAKYVNRSQLTDRSWIKEHEGVYRYEDALVLLVVDCTADGFQNIEINIPPHWIVAFPRQPIEFMSPLLELMAIMNLQARKDLIEKDHLLVHELGLLRSAVETSLRNTLEMVGNPDHQEVSWLVNGKIYDLSDQFTPDQALTELFALRFSKTPIIRNEQVVRRKISVTTRSARKRCNLAVLERTGTPHLGYAGSTSSDASIYRTVFENTGLYRQNGAEWGWVDPNEIKDCHLRHVWSAIEEFFARPSKHPKPFSDLAKKLISPPYGIREGLWPLLIAAGIQAFGRVIAVYKTVHGDQTYLNDLLPSSIEEICKHPDQFTLYVCPFSSQQLKFLRDLVELFNEGSNPEERDLVRAFYDGFIEWRSNLPSKALETERLGEEASILQPLFRCTNFDPIRSLVRDYPAEIGGRALTKRSIAKLKKGKHEIESVAELFLCKAVEAATEIFKTRLNDSNQSLLSAAELWSSSIPQSMPASRSWDHIANGVYRHSCQATKSHNDERDYVTKLSVILLSKSPEEWHDSDLSYFREKLLEVLADIESSILDITEYTLEHDPFIKSHMASLINQFISKIGSDKVKKLVDEICEERSLP